MKWIASQQSFDQELERIAAADVVAVDTEADSLHSYFDKVCLIQMTAADDDLVIDPLSGIDLQRFGAVLADERITKILHGGDYDVRILNRDFGFTVRNLVDTSICAQILGYEAFGLAALLERHFGVKLNKTHQRADWAMRPLTSEMLEYAALDTHYLIELAQKLRTELEALGRWEWAVEEFARLENVRYDKAEDPEPWRRMKNIGGFDRRGLAIIRELYMWRDALARKADRPPFKIIGNDQLIEITKAKPDSVAELSKVRGMVRYHLDRYGRDLVRIVRHALELPEDELPEKAEPKTWIRDKEVEARINRMKHVRDKIAAELKIDVAVLAPRHVLAAVAERGSYDDIPAMREWQKRVLGEAMLAAMVK
jgi:ribonuclease D